MNFWETLPESAYNSWQANKFKQQAIERLETMSDDELWGTVGIGQEAPSSNPYMKPAGSGGMYDTVKKWFGKGAKAAAREVDNVVGLSRGVESLKDTVQGYNKGVQKPIRGALFYALPDIVQGDSLDKYGAGDDPLTIWRKLGESAEKSKRSGVQQFAEDIASDPLTYVGGIGKAVSLAGKATHLPQLGRAGAAITRVENIPGNALAKGISKGGQSLYDNVLPEVLRRPSTRALTSQKSNEYLDMGRRLLNRFGLDAADIGPTEDPAVLKARQIILRKLSDSLDRGYSGPLGVSGTKEIEALGPDALKIMQTGLKSRVDDGNVQVWLDDISSRARDLEKKTIREGIRASREGSRGGQILNALDKPREIWERTGAPLQQKISRSILSTAGVAGGNVVEDSGRAFEAGVGTMHRGAGRNILGRNIPTPSLGMTKGEVNQALSDVPMKYPQLALSGQGSTTASAMGYGEAAKSRFGRALNIATGGTFTDVANKVSDRIRGEFIAKTFQKELAKIAPDVATATPAMKKAAMEAAEKLFEERFPVGMESNLAYFMKQIYPFWNYETRRWPYLAGLAARRPGVASTYGHYRENTDEGYIQFTKDLQIDPLRGTAFGVVDNIADPKDYPTFSTGISGDIEKLNALQAKAGFYPSTLAGVGQMIVRAAEGQPAEPGMLVPTAQKIQLQALRGSEIPGVSDAAGGILDNVLSNRFDEYAINKQLAKDGINPREATPEQRENAAESVARLQALMSEFGVFRWRPEEERQFKGERKTAALEAGVPQEAIDKAGKNNPLTVVNPETNERYLNSAQLRDVYNANPDWERWQQVAEPLKRPEDKKVQQQTDNYYKALDMARQKRDQELMRLAADWLKGTRDYSAIREERGQILSNFSAIRDQLAQQHPLALIDDQRRADYYAATGRQPINERPEDVAARSYFDIQPQRGADGQLDFDTYHKERQAVLDSLDPQTRSYVENDFVKKEYANEIIQLFEQDYGEKSKAYQEYLKIPKYRGLTEEQTKKVDEAAQQLTYLRQIYGDKDALVRAMLHRMNPEGAALLPHVAKRRNPERQRMVRANPQLRGFLSRAEQADLMESQAL